jgi:hypothetical protein
MDNWITLFRFSNGIGGALNSKLNQSSSSNSDSIDAQIVVHENTDVVTWFGVSHTTMGRSCNDGYQ